MEAITKDQLDKIKDSEWTILFVHADGCSHCQAAKPRVLGYSQQYLNIQFLSANLMDVLDYYNQFAEKTPEVTYEEIPDSNGEMREVPVLNEDGTPKISIKYTIPCLMVHHTKAQTLENPTGYVGAFNNTNEDEFITICEQISNFR
jgi:thiol-disulfide isomerase/thioredoxin